MKKLLLLSAIFLLSSSWSMGQSQSVEPPSGMSEIQAYSIFLENYKNESFQSAIEFGRWIWKGMPETIEGYSKFNLETNLDRLISAYGGMAEKSQDPSVREAYLDTALTIFNKVYEKFPEDQISYFDWRIKEGRFYQSHSDFIDNADAKAAEAYLEAYNMKPEEFAKAAQGYYVQVLLQSLVSAGKKDKALSIIKKTEPHASEKLKSYFNNVRNKLFDSPKERMAFLESQLKENPKDEEVLTQLRDLYQSQDMVAKASEISQKLYELNPTYENIMAVADNAISNASYDKALKYLKEAMDKAKDAEQKAEIAMKISNTYLNTDQLQEARRYAQMAMEQDSDWGKPYIQMADIYAQAVSQCTNNRKMTVNDRVVYWLVLDYLDKAKQVDSSAAGEVDRKYQAYKPVTPTTEQKFFNDWKTGQEMKVDSSIDECYGWINETTTVR